MKEQKIVCFGNFYSCLYCSRDPPIGKEVSQIKTGIQTHLVTLPIWFRDSSANLLVSPGKNLPLLHLTAAVHRETKQVSSVGPRTRMRSAKCHLLPRLSAAPAASQRCMRGVLSGTIR